MAFRLTSRLALVALFLTATHTVFSQIAPSGRGSAIPISVGVGFSDFDLDWGSSGGGTNRMEGITGWVDWRLSRGPGVLGGLGLELEVRDLNWGRPTALNAFRHDTALGGGFYTWRRYRKLHPYGKFLAGVGSFDFPHNAGAIYTHDTRTVFAPGVGLDYKVYRNIWLRGDYEYQFWPKLFGP